MKFARLSAPLIWLSLLTMGRALGQVPTAPQAELAPAVAPNGAADDDRLATVPVAGSQIPRDEVQCATCHTEPFLWEGEKQRYFVAQDVLDHDVHWQKGVVCSDCHGGDPTTLEYAEAHAQLVPSNQLRQRCVVCHNDQKLGLLKGVHAKAGEKDDRGLGLPLDCVKCHGTNAHEILPANDQRSPVFLMNQVHTCGSCHEEHRSTYEKTVHGKGLFESGLMVTAVCADCHGAHGIYYAADRRSTLHRSNVVATCSKCHQLIGDRLQKSIHSREGQLGLATENPAPGGRVKRLPSCTDCHQGHHLLSSDVPDFRLQVDNACGNCHADLSSRYALSTHGELTRQGYAAAANCADCHGSHDILPVMDPDSMLAPGKNRLHTCQKCHPHAVGNFTEFDPHANFKDAARFPTLHAVYHWINVPLNILFACFVVHGFLWFVRAFVERLQYGGHVTLVTDRYLVRRFSPTGPSLYAALIIAFFGLTLSGLPLKYFNLPGGRWLAGAFGGFRSASAWHHVFAVLAIAACCTYLIQALKRNSRLRRERNWKTVILGPDSLVPNGRDLRDLLKMLLWFIGFGQKPGFEKWTYWEKLEYWAFFLAAALIGFSGLMLWYPNLFCIVLPGRMLNVAKVVHSQFAIYTAGFLFLIHFYHSHFRPEKFPMDLSVLTGLVSEEHLRKYRPEYIARLEREGKLRELRQPAPSRRRLWLNIIGGLIIFAIGFCLLAITLLASLSE